jgi:hypothetical protein
MLGGFRAILECPLSSVTSLFSKCTASQLFGVYLEAYWAPNSGSIQKPIEGSVLWWKTSPLNMLEIPGNSLRYIRSESIDRAVKQG